MYHFPIYKFTPEVEYSCCWREAFTKDECDAIIQFGELAEFEKGRVGGGADEEGRVDEEARETDIVWLPPTNDNDWIMKKLVAIAARINYDKFQVDLTAFDGFQYSKYQVGGHYEWHVDPMTKPIDCNMHRKLSFSLMLTEPEDYEGGELLISPTGKDGNIASLKPAKGDLIAFYSFMPHKVAPVTKGERISLVTWALGPKYK
jgi:PKHD-type hydroxylase